MYNKYVKEQYEKSISSNNDEEDATFRNLVKEKKNKLKNGFKKVS